ncbi:MAG: hypothetical protein RIT40_617 [Planctomycetota bacterium]|jgi:hypothetical protein
MRGTLLFLAACGCIVVAPAFDAVVLARKQRLAGPHEGRALQPWPWHVPQSHFAQWPAQIEDAYADRMGLRDVWIAARNTVRYELCGVSPDTKVIFGPGEWLHLPDSTYTEFVGRSPLTDEHWSRLADDFALRSQALAEKGVRYLVAIAPDKETLYPETVPWPWNAGRDALLERYTQELALRGVAQIELLPPLLELKQDDPARAALYWRWGTHWSSLGAWAAANALLEAWSQTHPAVRPLPREALHMVPAGPTRVDWWASRLYLEHLHPAPTHEWLPQAPHATSPSYGLAERVVRASTHTNAQLPKVLVVHDSFGPALQPFLAEGARELRMIWDTALFETEVDRFKPDIVVQVYAERRLRQADLPWVPAAQAVTMDDYARLPVVEWSAARGETALRRLRGAPVAHDSQAWIAASGTDVIELPDGWRSPSALRALRVDWNSSAPVRFALLASATPDSEYDRADLRFVEREAGGGSVVLLAPALAGARRLGLQIKCTAPVRLTLLELRAAPE